jgi:hypothetical protein
MASNPKTSSDIDPPSFEANNNDLLVWSLFLLGGAEKWVDVEDIYLKAFELGPARLSWRTRADIPDYKKVSKALQSVEAGGNRWQQLLEKRGAYERKLSLAGQVWCQKYNEQLSKLYSGSAVVSSAATQAAGKRVREVEGSELFQRWRHDRTLELPEHELAEIFRCLPGSPRATWIGRFDEVVIAAERNGKSEVVDFVATARTSVLSQ